MTFYVFKKCFNLIPGFVVIIITCSTCINSVYTCICLINAHVRYVYTITGTLGMILRSTKRLYMRIFYSLVDDMPRYFTLKTINFASMDEDKGESLVSA